LTWLKAFCPFSLFQSILVASSKIFTISSFWTDLLWWGQKGARKVFPWAWGYW
jgi:hypothetical protein